MKNNQKSNLPPQYQPLFLSPPELNSFKSEEEKEIIFKSQIMADTNLLRYSASAPEGVLVKIMETCCYEIAEKFMREIMNSHQMNAPHSFNSMNLKEMFKEMMSPIIEAQIKQIFKKEQVMKDAIKELCPSYTETIKQVFEKINLIDIISSCTNITKEEIEKKIKEVKSDLPTSKT